MGNNATGTAIRTLRRTAGLSLQEVSKAAGVSISYLSRAETGDVTPKPIWIANVIDAIGSRIKESA